MRTGVAALSGPGGATLRLFDSLKGHLLAEKHLHSPHSGQLFEPPIHGVALAFDSDLAEDVYSLSNGGEVRRIDGATGEVKWSWVSPDQTYVYLSYFLFLEIECENIAQLTTFLISIQFNSAIFQRRIHTFCTLRPRPREIIFVLHDPHYDFVSFNRFAD